MVYASEIAEIVARQFWRLLLVFLVVTGVVGYALLSRPDVFEARTLLLYKLGRDYIYVPEVSDTGARAPDPGDLQLVVNAEMQILNSARLKREVIDRFGATTIYPGLEGHPDPVPLALEMLNDSVSISLITGSYVVRLGVMHGDPQMAADLSSALVDAYMLRRSEIFRGDDVAFIREQLEIAEGRAEEIDNQIAELLDGKHILAFDASSEILSAEHARLREEITAVDALLAALDRQQAVLASELTGIDATIVDVREYQPNPVVGNVRGTTIALEGERRAAAARLGEAHPDVLRLDREIAALGAMIDTEPEEIQTVRRITANPLHRQAEEHGFTFRLARAENESRRRFLEERLRQNEAELAAHAAKMGDVEVLREKRSLQTGQIASLFSRLQDATEMQTLEHKDQTNVRIIEPPTPVMEPIGLSKKVRALIAAFLGMVAAGGVLLAALFVRQNVATAPMTQHRLQLPVLGEVAQRSRRELRSLSAA